MCFFNWIITSSITAVGTLDKTRLKHKRCLCLLSVIHCCVSVGGDLALTPFEILN